MEKDMLAGQSLHQATKLLSQQIWCWGRDIEASAGNLLVRYGFMRTVKQAESHAHSLYRLELPSSRIVLRGFGIFFGDDGYGGLFLPRDRFRPLYRPEPDLPEPVWSMQDLPRLKPPHAGQISSCQCLFVSLLDWIIQYENWIAITEGTAYRDETLIDWKARKNTVISAEETAKAWQLLRIAVCEQPYRFIRTHEGQNTHRGGPKLHDRMSCPCCFS